MNINQLIKSYGALLLSFTGAVCLFLSSIVMKVVAPLNSFIEFSQLVVVASMAFTWGVLGFDNYFAKHCKLEGCFIIIRISELRLLCILPIVGSLLLSVFSFYFIFNGKGSLFHFTLLSCMVGFSLCFFTIAKVLGENILCQFFSSLWKFSLLIVAIITYVHPVKINYLVSLIVLILFLSSLVVIKIKLLNRIKVKEESGSKLDLKIWFAIFFTISVVTMLSQLDRVFIARYFGEAEFAKYFFWSAIYFSPVVIYSSYLGVKNFSSYKAKKANYFNLQEDLKKIIFLSTISFAMSTLLGLILVHLFPSKITWPSVEVFVVIVAIGFIRSVYIYLSSLIQLYIETSWAIKKGVSLILYVFFGGVLFEVFNLDLKYMFLFLVTVWSIRTYQYFSFLQIKMRNTLENELE